jgi:hypothetical protein
MAEKPSGRSRKKKESSRATINDRKKNTFNKTVFFR